MTATNNYVRVVNALCAQHGLPKPKPEHRFAPPRQWRLDFAFLKAKVALEVEGGIWIQGRHSRGAGMLKDMEKYNRAAALGWRIVRCTPTTLLTGIEAVVECLSLMYLPEAVTVKGTAYFPGLVDVRAFPALKEFCVPASQMEARQ